MSKFSFKNPFNQTFDSWSNDAQAHTNEQTAKAAAQLFADKPFTTEHRTTYNLSRFLKWAAAAISFLSASFAAYYVFSFLFGAYIAAAGAVAVCLLIELLKNSIWSTTAKQRLKYRSGGAAGGLVLVALHVLSFGASVFGAVVAADYLPKGSDPASGSGLVDVAKVAEPYDQQTTAIDNQTAALLTERPNERTGKISSTTKGIIKQLNSQRDSLQTAKKTALEHSKKQNDISLQTDKEKAAEIATAHQERIFFYKWAAAVFAGIFELIFIFAQAFTIKYLFRSYIDSQQTKNDATAHVTTHVTAAPTDHSTEPNGRTPIGFKMPGLGAGGKIGVGGVGECACCKKSFTKNAHNQKFCGDGCRIEAWEKKHNKKLVSRC